MSPKRSLGSRVILRTKSDWDDWYENVVDAAVSCNVWEYVNPDSNIPEPPNELIEPRPVDACKDGGNTGKSFPTATEKEEEDLTGKELRRYRRLRREYVAACKKRQALARFRSFLVSRVDPIHRNTVKGVRSPREILVQLSQILRPTFLDRLTSYRERKTALQHVPKDEDVETWIYQWIDLTKEQIQEEGGWRLLLRLFTAVLDELDPDLVSAARRFNDKSFEETALASLQHWHEKRADGPPPPPVAVEDAADEPQQPNRKCVCGRRHEFKDCYYLIPSVRPHGWKGNRKTHQKIDAMLMRNRNLKDTITSIQRDAEMRANSDGFERWSVSSSEDLVVPVHDESLFGRVSFAA